MNGRLLSKRWNLFHARENSSSPISSFSIDEVTRNSESRLEFASANYRKNGNLFRMVLPPPNVTGKLHLGHALTVAIQDSICRHQRIQGNRAEWIPGFDHAGIATQVVVEKMLQKQGRKRQNMKREQFLQECHKWSEKCSTEIRQQLSRMGASLDWRQSYYTLDPEFSEAVTKAFCTLHKDGMISRGERIVHWCPSLASTLSSQEVLRIDVPSDGLMEIPGIESGKRSVKLGLLHLVRYKLPDTDEYIEVGTTRPETLFADIAIAVHPDDARYAKFIGKSVLSPVLEGKKLLVVADSAVSMKKGTGAVKITPHHDPLDYEIWNRNKNIINSTKTISCIDENGKMTTCGPGFDNLDRFEAREKVLEFLVASSAYGGVMKHEGAQVNVCSRTGDILEPRLAQQWFLDCKEMFESAINAIKNHQIRIYPEYQAHRLLDWFQNDEPWCLSRQLLWGHQVPAFRKQNNTEDWVVAENVHLARKLLEVNEDASIYRDEDVLDTWFSSSLVPLVKNGWLANECIRNPSLDIMETGWDISGFWVARMMAMGIHLSGGNLPFGKVLLHGLVRDNEGRKMSKSLGNVIDPLDVLDGISLEKMVDRVEKAALTNSEIATAVDNIKNRFPNGIERCGPDALRFALLKYDVQSSDIPLDISVVAVEGLRFCNKLWNLAAYYDKLKEKCDVLKDVDSDRLVDEWIMAELASTISKVDTHMNNFSLHLALSTLHQFVTSELCDVYLETTKRALWSDDLQRISQARSVLQRVLQPVLVQLSVFMPFVTEYLYERIFSREPGSINFDVVKPSLFIFHQNPELQDAMKVVTAAMSAVRSLRQKLELSQKIVFEGILEISTPLYVSKQELKNLASDVTPVCGLQVQQFTFGKVDSNSDYMACPIPGHDAKLWLKIENESKELFIKSLEKQLEKAKLREQQFLTKTNSYEEICQNPQTKPSSVEKNRRKAENSRKVSLNAKEEAARIEELIANQK